MNLIDRVKTNFRASIETKKLTQDALAEKIVIAAEIMIACLKNNNKILSCGNGGSAADAQHFAAEMLNKLQIDRSPLAAIALTTDTSTLTSIANDYDYSEIFSKQIRALGRTGDVLLAISTSGNSKNITTAIRTAQQLKLRVIALTGKDGGVIKNILRNEQDIGLCIPDNNTQRIQEAHILLIHCLCDLIEFKLFGES